MKPPRLAVVGVHGYGASHVMTALALAEQGRAELVALVDPLRAPVVRDGTTLQVADLPPFHPDLGEALATGGIDVVVVATPLHTHAALARQALAAGADVLLEKPPVTSRAELAELLACEEAAPGRVQVGFQGLGSAALSTLARAVAAGELGTVRRIGAWGSWTRDRAYYARAPWAGRRRLGGIDVVDGALTNPFAHAVMGALVVAGRTSADAVGPVEVDLYRAHDIEADDTAALRVGPVTAAFTLAGPREALPVIEVVGSASTARLQYTRDRLDVDGPAAALSGDYGRVDLLDDLLAAREHGGPLIAPLSATAGFVEVVEAVRAAEPTVIPARFVRWDGEGPAGRPVIDGVDAAIARAVREQRLFRELDVPWAR